MFRTIVAVSDGHAKRSDAVALARTIADAQHAQLVLVTAYDDPFAPATPVLGRHAGRRAHRARPDVARVRDGLAPGAGVVAMPAPSAAHAVSRAAEREHADLIVVGSNRRRGDGHASGPDRALQVLRGASCAVAVVPDGGRAPGRLESLAVGFDGSRESWSALALAVDLARTVHADLRVCLALDDHVPGGSAPWAAAVYGLNRYGVAAERHRHAGELLDRAMATAAAAGLEARADLLVGDPERALAAVPTDLVVVGSRCLGALRRRAFGSTAEALIRHASTPMLVAARSLAQERTDDIAARADVAAPAP